MATDVKKQIADTFEKHAKKSGMDKVTINAIVSECKISRQAFYYYFQDIVDVARYMMRERLRLTFNAGEETNPREASRIFAEDVVSQFPTISIALNSKFRGEMELLLIAELKEFFFAVFTRHNCGRDLSRKQIEFQSDYLACGMAAYAMEHCSEPNFDSKQFSQMLWEMLRHTYGEE